jgi:hypothetical protein
MVLAGNVGLIFLIRIKLVGNNHGRHGGGSIWMFVMEGNEGRLGRGNLIYTKIRVSLATLRRQRDGVNLAWTHYGPEMRSAR